MTEVYLKIKCCNQCPKSRGCRAKKKTFNQLKELLETSEFAYLKEMPPETSVFSHMIWPDCPLHKTKDIRIIKQMEAEIERLKCCGNCRYWKLENGHDKGYFECISHDSTPINIDSSYQNPAHKCDKWEYNVKSN